MRRRFFRLTFLDKSNNSYKNDYKEEENFIIDFRDEQSFHQHKKNKKHFFSNITQWFINLFSFHRPSHKAE